MKTPIENVVYAIRAAFSKFTSNTPVVLAILAVTSCCPFGYWSMYVAVDAYEDQGYGNPPPAFQVGDTVQFLAEERFYEATCRTPAHPSNQAPDKYEWRTSGPSATVTDGGLTTFSDTGDFQLTVSTSHTEKLITRQIVSRVAEVRLTPNDVTVDVGDTVLFLVEALDERGVVIPELNLASRLLRLRGRPNDWENPVAGNLADNDSTHFFWGAIRPGVVTLRARVAVYGTESIVATGRLEVR